LKNTSQGDIAPNTSGSGWNEESKSAIWRPQKTPGVQIGKYQSKEQVCTKEAADLFSDAAPAPVHQRQPVASQPVRSWSSIGRYTSGQQRVVVRPHYDSGPETSHQRRMAQDSEPYPNRDRESFEQRNDED
jgi:hypothetical protein